MYSTKPFLRWAGGKTWLIRHIKSILYNNSFRNYHEPFLGGASLFLSIESSNSFYLSDINTELINTYKNLRDYPEDIISELGTFRNTEKFYYKIRALKTNDPIIAAAKFIYLNQISFNGIYRVNLRGEYNVPYGFRTKDFFQPQVLRQVSQRLKSCNLFDCDFSETQININPGDLIYLDPPYTVSHSNNGFIKYNQKLFSLKDQVRLSEFIDIIKQKGAYYILSNAYHANIIEIFNKGDVVLQLERASIIGGKKAKRGKVSELLFTNINIRSND